MGSVLPKPILSKVVERAGNGSVNAACASVNGYRSSMEDAHMLVAEDGAKYSYFGVFDGHNNEKCSEFVAAHMPARLKALKDPITAADLERVCIESDEAFFKQDNEGGSTGTFCLIGADYKVKIANVGDSRILISRKGELLFETEDHKPYNPIESERIVRCGGSVTNNRVDGDLAVSRAFGDSMFKVAGTKDYKNQKVIAVPDVSEVQCQAGDTIILACDGVFEGDFSNREVCAFVQEQMNKCWGDLAVISCRVCDQAILRGSKDNISCMIVQLEEGASKVKSFGHSAFVPGPPFPRNHEGCRTAYIKMAELGHVTAGEALQRRYQLLQKQTKGQLSSEPPVMRTAFEMSDEVDVDTETTFFGRGPSPGNEKAFFSALAQGNN